MKLWTLYALLSCLALVNTAMSIEFNVLLEKADSIDDVQFHLIETTSAGGSTITDLQANVISSKMYDLSKYEMLDETGDLIMTVYIDGENGRVYYKIKDDIAEAPSDEAEDMLLRMHSFYTLRTLYESGSDVYSTRTTVLEGRPVEVFNIYQWGEEPNHWGQVYIDPDNGMVCQQYIYTEDMLKTRIYNKLRVNIGISEDIIMEGIPLGEYPVMSVKELLVDGKRPVDQPATSSKDEVRSQESLDERMAHFEKVIPNLRTVIDRGHSEPKMLNLLATTLCSKAFLSKTLSEADESISLYRSVLSDEELSEYDQTVALLGLSRALLCKAYLVPAENGKYELMADKILQKLTGDEKLDPELRNIAGMFSMKWQESKDQGNPEKVLDWYNWMTQLQKWKSNHSE